MISPLFPTAFGAAGALALAFSLGKSRDLAQREHALHSAFASFGLFIGAAASFPLTGPDAGVGWLMYLTAAGAAFVQAMLLINRPTTPPAIAPLSVAEVDISYYAEQLYAAIGSAAATMAFWSDRDSSGSAGGHNHLYSLRSALMTITDSHLLRDPNTREALQHHAIKDIGIVVESVLEVLRPYRNDWSGGDMDRIALAYRYLLDAESHVKTLPHH